MRMTKESYNFGVDTEAQLHTETSGMTDNIKCPICDCDMEYTVSESGLKEYSCVSCQYSYEVEE